MTTQYTITFDSSRDLPTDVILEHIGYALRNYTKLDGAKLSNFKIKGAERVARAHPFDGEELFDDEESDEVRQLTEAIKLIPDEFDKITAGEPSWDRGGVVNAGGVISVGGVISAGGVIYSLERGEKRPATSEDIAALSALEAAESERVGLDKTYPNLWAFLNAKRNRG